MKTTTSISLQALMAEVEDSCQWCGEPIPPWQAGPHDHLCPECREQHELELEYDDLSEAIVRSDNERALKLAVFALKHVVRTCQID